jgi:hypothetical protein
MSTIAPSKGGVEVGSNAPESEVTGGFEVFNARLHNSAAESRPVATPDTTTKIVSVEDITVNNLIDRVTRLQDGEQTPIAVPETTLQPAAAVAEAPRPMSIDAATKVVIPGPRKRFVDLLRGDSLSSSWHKALKESPRPMAIDAATKVVIPGPRKRFVDLLRGDSLSSSWHKALKEKAKKKPALIDYNS